MLHLGVPLTRGREARPTFLSSDIEPDLVYAVVDTAGTMRCAAALHRLVQVLMDGAACAAPLAPLVGWITTTCRDLGLENQAPEPSLCIDDYAMPAHLSVADPQPAEFVHQNLAFAGHNSDR